MDLNQIKMLKSDLDCSYEIGIWSEIDSFLECREEYILEKKVSYLQKEEQYLIIVKLKDSTEQKERIFFKELVDFLEYGRATSYLKSALKKQTRYYLLSETNDKKGFFLELNIL
ncbi:hypothetical protein HRH42_12595 [Enterococcus faecalis]|nr:hypothetical protein [Enterococcus faecalis]